VSEPLNDELQIHISVKWAIQLILFVVSITSAWFTLNASIDNNSKELQYVKQSLIEFEEMLNDRLEPLEAEREQRLTEMNKSLLDKVLGKSE